MLVKQWFTFVFICVSAKAVDIRSRSSPPLPRLSAMAKWLKVEAKVDDEPIVAPPPPPPPVDAATEPIVAPPPPPPPVDAAIATAAVEPRIKKRNNKMGPALPFLEPEGRLRSGAIGSADFPIGGPGEQGELRQQQEMEHVDIRAHRAHQSHGPDSRAETERRIKEAQAFRDLLRQQVDDLRKYKRDGLKAIHEGRAPPTFVDGGPAEKPRESLKEEYRRKQAEKAAKANAVPPTNVGQDRL